VGLRGADVPESPAQPWHFDTFAVLRRTPEEDIIQRILGAHAAIEREHHVALERASSTASWREAIHAADRAYDGEASSGDAELLRTAIAPFVAMVRSRWDEYNGLRHIDRRSASQVSRP
jgi:hypothetical protein